MLVQDGQARGEIAQSLLRLMVGRATGTEELWPVISLNWLRQRRAKWNYGTRNIGSDP
jgi:hypothetical protein